MLGVNQLAELCKKCKNEHQCDYLKAILMTPPPTAFINSFVQLTHYIKAERVLLK